MSSEERELQSICRRWQKTRILVVGDFLIDEFVFGEIDRVSREAPVLILNYQETRHRPGGAANTVQNAAALGARVFPVGYLGEDELGSKLLQIWEGKIDTQGIQRYSDLKTTSKSRILAGSFHSFQQQVVRIDTEQRWPRDRGREQALLARFEDLLEEVDAVLISDYSLGTLHEELGRKLIEKGRRHGLPVVVDSRDFPHLYRGASAVTPNITEIERSLKRTAGNDPERVADLGRRALRDWDLEALLVTRGKLGITLLTEEQTLHFPAFGSDEAVDVTGAGDTVAATFAVSLAAGASFAKATRLANYAGGLVVMKKGTATVSLKEIEQAIAKDFQPPAKVGD